MFSVILSALISALRRQNADYADINSIVTEVLMMNQRPERWGAAKAATNSNEWNLTGVCVPEVRSGTPGVIYHALAKCQVGGKIQEWMCCPLGSPPPLSIYRLAFKKLHSRRRLFLLKTFCWSSERHGGGRAHAAHCETQSPGVQCRSQ